MLYVINNWSNFSSAVYFLKTTFGHEHEALTVYESSPGHGAGEVPTNPGESTSNSTCGLITKAFALVPGLRILHSP